MTVEGTDDLARPHRRWRMLAPGCLALGLLAAAPAIHAVEAAGSPPGKLDLVEFQSGPFPFHGINAGLNRPFLDINANGRLGHDSVRGGVYWEDPTYKDGRS